MWPKKAATKNWLQVGKVAFPSSSPLLRNSEEIFLQKSENGRERKCESDCFLLSVIESCCQKAKTKQILKITKCETNRRHNESFV
jgi:hypothetical protein